MTTLIVARTDMLATHRWPDAPERRKYLSNVHAHIFKFEARAKVKHSDREVEFHDLRQELHEVLGKIADFRIGSHPPSFGDLSCEQIGERILEAMPKLLSIVVSEDGQFDAEVIRDDKQQSDGKKRAYIASSSKGDRGFLHLVCQVLASKNYMVFAPCLGFHGQETPEIRPLIMEVCLHNLIKWSQGLFILDEGIPSEGCDIERGAALAAGIPVYEIKTIHDLEDK
jgi:hypothetical protein